MSERSFPPSVKKLRQLRRQGKVPSSRFLSDFMALVGATLALASTRFLFENGGLVALLETTERGPIDALRMALLLSLKFVLILVGCAAGGAILGKLIQSGGLFVPSMLAVDVGRIRPGAYSARIRDAIADAALGLLRVGIVFAAVLPGLVELIWSGEELLIGQSEGAMMPLMGLAHSALLRGFSALGVLAVASFYLARWRFISHNRMTLQEIREEYRSDEGDPHTKSARRHEHRIMTSDELEKIVRSAKVVVVRRAA